MFAFFTLPSANALNVQSDQSDHDDHNDLNGHGHTRNPAPALEACRAWSVDREKRPQRGQFLPDLQPHSTAMGQKDGKKWTAAAALQPTNSKSDRLLDLPALVGAAAWSRLPAAVQRRFGAAHADVTYQGHLDMRCSAIGHVYAALARLWGGPLTHLNRRAVPTTVRVSHNGCGGVVWERRFHTHSTGAGAAAAAAAANVAGVNGADAVGDANANANANDRTVRSTKELGADGGLLERTDGGLSMSLDVFEESGALVFRSRSFWWVLGRVRLAVPTLLTPGTCTVAHTDLGGGQFRFTLSMQHPWWGETFHQSGVFTDPCSDEDDSTDTSVTTNVTAST